MKESVFFIIAEEFFKQFQPRPKSRSSAADVKFKRCPFHRPPFAWPSDNLKELHYDHHLLRLRL